MSKSTMRPCVRAWLVAITCASQLMACGGGGGASADSPPPAPGPDEPTVALVAGSGRFETPAELAQITASAASHALNAAQLGVDLTMRLAKSARPSPLVAQCPISGTVTLRLDDRDANGKSSPGDVLTAQFSRCGYPLMQRILDGDMTVTLQSDGSSSIERSVQAQVSFGNGLGMVPLIASRPSNWDPAFLKGSLEVRWTQDDTSLRLQVASTAADNFGFEGFNSGSSILMPLAMRRLDLLKIVRYDDARISTNVNYILTASAGNRLVVSSSTPWQSDLDAPLDAGRVIVSGANGQTLSVTPTLSGTVPVWRAELRDRTGTLIDSRESGIELEQNSLRWDARQSVGRVYGGSLGSRVEFPADVIGASAGDLSGLLSLFFQRSDLDPRRLRIDPLFLHPVGPRADSTEPGAVVRVQAPAALDASQPSVQFRFRDPIEFAAAAIQNWSVPATTQRHGSLFVVSPTEPLRFGRNYYLEASTDGLTWSDSVSLRTRNGGSVLLLTGASIGTPPTLVVTVDAGSGAMPAPTHPVRLSAKATTVPDTAFLERSEDAAVVRWRWEQLSGAPLLFGTPDAPDTTITYPAGVPRAVDRALVQLSVTDTVGRVQRARVLLRAGEFAPTGSLDYRALNTTFVPGEIRLLDVGTGTIRQDDYFQPGTWLMTLRGDFLIERDIWFRMPDGGRLAVGVYDAVGLPAPVGKAGFLCLSSPCPAGSSGRFEILEAETAPDGTVSRLAMDYDWTDTLQNTTVQRGSFRLNSSLPVRP